MHSLDDHYPCRNTVLDMTDQSVRDTVDLFESCDTIVMKSGWNERTTVAATNIPRGLSDLLRMRPHESKGISIPAT